MSLDEIRKKIDAIDEKIIGLLGDRMKLALEIGKLKQKERSEVYAPARESEIYRKIEALPEGTLSKDALKAIYREVMSASLALEKPVSDGPRKLVIVKSRAPGSLPCSHSRSCRCVSSRSRLGGGMQAWYLS